MHSVLDLLTSGVHDAKNQLFIAESAVVRAEAEHGIALDDARFAIEHAARRLQRALTAYRCERELLALDVGMVHVPDLIDEAGLVSEAHLRQSGLTLDVACEQDLPPWAMDRELVLDVLSNALHNASRFARSRVRLSAVRDVDALVLSVEDDGPGFDTVDAAAMARRGLGLFVAREIARRHARNDTCGRLELDNGGALGGALFRLVLP
tara:strand:- start:3370 stop:3993 length:624 start_codon:yes stop_codon:yes gene_type:complete